MHAKKIIHSDLSQPVYEELKRMILDQTLEPGQKIIQERIAKDLGVSRTPLNKALQQLEHEMLVESIPRRGMFVKEINLKEMYDVFICREALESMAVKLLCNEDNLNIAHRLEKHFQAFQNSAESIDENKYHRADQNFHRELIESTENKVMMKLYIMSHLHDRISQMGLLRTPHETLTEHIAIIKAIRQKNPDKASEAAALHIRKSRELIFREMTKGKK